MAEVINHWLLRPEAWIIIGILFVGAELLLGTGYFSLTLGSGALILGLVLLAQEFGAVKVVSDWKDVSYLYGFATLASIGLLRAFARKRGKQHDINKY